MRVLERERRVDEAEAVLLECCTAAEQEAKAENWPYPAPWYAWELALLYRTNKEQEKEKAILQRFLEATERDRAANNLTGRTILKRLDELGVGGTIPVPLVTTGSQQSAAPPASVSSPSAAAAAARPVAWGQGASGQARAYNHRLATIEHGGIRSRSGSTYDQRDEHLYYFYAEPQKAQNEQILSWWTDSHDALLAAQIARWQWAWPWTINEEVERITSGEVLNRWKKANSRVNAPATVLMYFCVARADELRLTDTIREPQRRDCLTCRESFLEDSLPFPLIRRLGVDHVDFCAPCLSSVRLFPNQGDEEMSANHILEYLRELADMVGAVPSQSIAENLEVLRLAEPEQRPALLALLKKSPSVPRVKAVFGSWFEALLATGLLEEGTRKNARGYQTLARDGHMCFSLGEKTIDDWLFEHAIPHDREPPYPEGNYRADWLVRETFVEYFGLAGDADYDARIEEKKRICERHGIILVAIHPKDLASRASYEKKLEGLLVEAVVR